MLLGWMPPGFAVIGLLLLIIGIALLAVAKFWPESTRPIVTAISPVDVTPLMEPADSAVDIVGPVTVFARTISWPLQIDETAGTLSEDERRYVIDGLAIVGDSWSAELLAQAFDEEDDDMRLTVVEAIARCSGEAVLPTLERAYASYIIQERYAAIDGASRRGDVELLDRGIRDTDGVVAIAAAYGLMAAKRADLVEAALAGREDARANEIRRILTLLG
jgi:hypothetical protein